MARKRQEGMTERETEIMHVVWDLEVATVEQVRERVPGQLADSTVRTMLSIMEEKGYVRSTISGRARVYRARVRREQVQSSALRALTRRLFAGSSDQLVARLVEDEQLSLEELDRLRDALRRREKGP